MARNIKKDFVDKQIVKFSTKDTDNKLFLRHERIIDLVLRHSNSNDLILDIGSSDGKVLKVLEKRGYRYLYAVDFSSSSFKSFKNSSIHFAPCDIEREKIPFRKKFDVVIFSDVLEHLFSPQTVLFDIRGILKNDARIVFSVPNAGWFLNGFLLSLAPSKLFISTAFGPWGHTYNFTFFGTRKIASNLKLKVIELSGGKLDNFAFKEGLKKIIYDIFLFFVNPLALLYPQLFSAHIFGVFQYTKASLKKSDRFELG